MSSVFFTPSIALLRLRPRYESAYYSPSALQLEDYGQRFHRFCVRAAPRKKASQIDATETPSDDDLNLEEGAKAAKRPSRRTKKKTSAKDEDEVTPLAEKEEDDPQPKKVSRRGRKKASETPETEAAASELGPTEEKKVRRRRTKKTAESSDEENESLSMESPPQPPAEEKEDEEEEIILSQSEEEESGFASDWPPLICCFGAVQHGFIPAGRPANRLIDHEIHDTKKDMFWSPEKFIRAPGSSASSVALALASLGARVEVMGKLGDDDYGRTLLYHLNSNNVQTRSIKIDSSRPTAASRMKLARRGGLKSSCSRPCAEDNFLTSDVNVDVLKEAKMFYFNSSSLLNENLRKVMMRAVRASKKLGGVIFFDLNLPLPLWESREETMALIREAWESANVIELTKQELEFLCGIVPEEEFDTKNNAKSKFPHHKLELVKSFWHEGLKVVFVTNGTSKIHFYTEEEEGWVRGMEDAPITPFTGEMSASGDAIVAALMKMMSVQPHLMADKEYLRHMSKYAITCGVIDQWTAARVSGFPCKEGFDGVLDGNGARSISEKEFRTVVVTPN
ncbi:fructokinase-like protein [Wolffia australiana]